MFDLNYVFFIEKNSKDADLVQLEISLFLETFVQSSNNITLAYNVKWRQMWPLTE